ncbi:unnamed protein product [Diatraea saccharalis]|uniref:Uncharacterized protein n=1 Tax=Diatraea saccharalis TaxID=40085 RepID=A0A9N9QZP3_9NEOP|nr:unnamed protein product [Diatraea saccharalis]
MCDEFACELDVITKTTLQVYFLRNVKNTEEIKNNIIAGTWKCAVIKANLILDPFLIAVAANRAVVSEKLNTLVTRTVYTEILYNLSLTKNITQSLCRFGIENNSDLLVCFLKTSDMDCGKEILSKIDGDICPLSNLKDVVDKIKIKSLYKLNDLKHDIDLVDIIVSRMVTKTFVSH